MAIAKISFEIDSQDEMDLLTAAYRKIQDLRKSGIEGRTSFPLSSSESTKMLDDSREGEKSGSEVTSTSEPNKPAKKKATRKSSNKAVVIDISQVREKIHEVLQRGPQAKPFVMDLLKQYAPETGRLSDVSDLDGLSQALGN